MLNQEVIRAANETRKNRYNLNKHIQRQFKPGVIRQVKKRLHDAIFEDPDEEQYFADKEATEKQLAEAKEEESEEEYQQTALDVTYNITKQAAMVPISNTLKVAKFMSKPFRRGSKKAKKQKLDNEEKQEKAGKEKKRKKSVQQRYSMMAPGPKTPQPGNQ